jgi:hypothetical protein
MLAPLHARQARHRIMIKYVIRGLFTIGACVLSFLLWTAFHIPGFGDVDVANAVEQAVAQSYGQFEPRGEADKTYRGKAIYAHPGSGGNPSLVIYEVTDQADRQRIVAAARAALDKAQAHSVTLRFYERQNVTQYSGGGIRRGPEHLIETVRVSQAAQ